MYEPMTSLLFQMACQRSGCIVDGGASEGHFSKLALAAGRTQADVFAFEPRPSEFNKLNDVAVIAINYALWSSRGAAPLYYAPERRFTASLKPEVWHTKVFDVKVTTLDAFFPVTPIAVVKLDIEGAEPEAIRGGHSVIQTYRPILFVEVLSNEIGAEIMAALPCGYSYHRIFDDTMSVKAQDALTVGNSWGNFMLLPKT